MGVKKELGKLRDDAGWQWLPSALVHLSGLLLLTHTDLGEPESQLWSEKNQLHAVFVLATFLPFSLKIGGQSIKELKHSELTQSLGNKWFPRVQLCPWSFLTALLPLNIVCDLFLVHSASQKAYLLSEWICLEHKIMSCACRAQSGCIISKSSACHFSPFMP